MMMNTKQKLLWIIKTLVYVSAWIGLFYIIPWYGRFFMIMWFGGLFFQSAFFHRYAAHPDYSMSVIKEKVAYVGAFLFQGSSYLSAYAYALMHRIHHAFTDTEKDPHSPNYDANGLDMMRRTAKIYNRIFKKGEYMGEAIPEKFKKNVPVWHSFDKLAHTWVVRLAWVAGYAIVYLVLALKVDHAARWEWWIIVPLMLITCILGPFHGMIVNWYGHTFGYRNFATKDLSRNIGKWILSIPMNFIMMGEDLHNNHHAYQYSPNFAKKWWEYDFIYTLLWTLDRIRIIKLKMA